MSVGPIPKVIHYCWFGGKEMSEETKSYIDEWREICPDYKFMKWDETNFDVNKYKYTQEAYENKKWAFVSDVCRLEKLHEYGGIYVDVNTRVLKKFDPLLSNSMFIGFEQDGVIAPSVFGARKGHGIVKTLLNRYKSESLFNERGDINLTTINNRLQPILIEAGMRPDNSLQKLSDIVVYPKSYFQPRYWNSARQDEITKNTYTIHYFGASWLDDKQRDWIKYISSDTAPKVSIIVPIYNVEAYLEECVDSILSQYYQNIEVILVVDAATDNSGVIADRYGRQDDRIKVLHKPSNEGLNMARASGLSLSTGEFVTFIDSDDRVEPGYVEELLRAQVATGADITMCGYTHYDSTLRSPLPIQPFTIYPELESPKVYSQNQIIKAYLLQGDHWKHNNVITTTYCKLFSRKILVKLDWKKSNYTVGEDDFETIYTFAHVRKAAVINSRLYRYRANPNSLSNSKSFSPKYNGKTVSVFNICKDFTKKALDLYGDRYEKEVYYRSYVLYRYYIVQLIKKGSLTMRDVAIFDREFPMKHVKLLSGNWVDKGELELIESKGLAVSLVERLWRENDSQTLRVEDMKLRLADLNEELRSVREELDSHLTVKRSIRLLAGNIKRLIGRPRG